MFTRCPGCHTVHPVNAALLSQARGQYRCAKCNKTSNALESLFDTWPDSAEAPSPRGQAPVLGGKIELQADGEKGEFALDLPGGQANRRRWPWVLGVTFLLLLTAGNLFWLASQQPDRLPALHGLLQQAGLVEKPSQGPWRDTAQIRLMNRSMQTHPDTPGTLLLSLTLVNQARRAQPFPGIEVTLSDGRGDALAGRVFQPSEYLSSNATLSAGMKPGAYLPVSLELVDPGTRAAGFEIRFR